METGFIDIIIYLSTDWKSCGKYSTGTFGDAPFISALSKLPGIRILCINQPFTPLETTIKKKPKAIKWIKGERLEKLGGNIFLYTSFAFIHDMLAAYVPTIQNMNRAVLSWQIKRQLNCLGFDSPIRISWIYHPLQYSYFGLADEEFRVYKCWDLYRARSYPEKLRLIINDAESKIVAGSNVILTPCINLYNELSLLNVNTHFTPAGVDIPSSDQSLSERAAIPEEMRRLKSPRIGFAGVISKRVDLSLIRLLAEKHPDWSIVMLGKITEGRDFTGGEDYCACSSLPNVHFLGFKEFDALPSYIRHFDVCMLPHSDIEVMKYSHPYKALQYLALGRPVVSTGFPDAQYYRDVVSIARDKGEFVRFVEEELKDNSEHSVKKRMDFAKKNTWDKRAKETYGILLDMIKQPQNKKGDIACRR